MRVTEQAAQFRPIVQRWIDESLSRAGVQAGGGSSRAHELSGPLHTGTLASSQAPQFLLRDGSRSLTGNLIVESGITIDGVDLSAFKSLYDAHLSADSHTLYAHAEGSGTRRAYEAGRLTKSLLAGNGISVSPGGALTQDQTISVSYSGVNPPKVGLGPQSTGSSPLASRSDHVHELDLTIAPTWGGLHTFNAGLKVGNGHTLALGDDTTLARTAANLIESGVGDNLLMHGVVGIGTSLTGGALAAKLHILGGASDTLMLLDGGSTRKLKVTVGTAFDGTTNVPMLESDNYASQTTGLRVDAAGGGDFRYLYANEMHVRAFIADVMRAHAGGQIISKSMALISREFTIPAVSSAAYLYVYDLPGFAGLGVFDDNDYVRLRVIDFSGGGLVVTDAWGQVTTPGFPPSTNTGEQVWTFTTRYAGVSNVAVGKKAVAGGPALDYGVSGDGVIEMTVLDPNSPWIQMSTWVTNPWMSGNWTVHTRTGKLTGVTSDVFGALTGWGSYQQNSYNKGTLYATAGRITGGVIIGDGAVTAWDVSGWAHGSDATYIDGGTIYTQTIQAHHLNVGLGGGNLLIGANWQDDVPFANGTMPGGWNYAISGAGVTNYRLITDDGSVTGIVNHKYLYTHINSSPTTSYAVYRSTNYTSVNTALPYTLSIWGRTFSGTTNVLVGLECFNSSFTHLGDVWCTLYNANLSTTPTRYKGTVKGIGVSSTTFFANTKYVRVVIYGQHQPSAIGGSALWDVQFEQGEMPTPWYPGLRGNVQIDSEQIMVGTPGAQRAVLGSTGLRGYSSGNVEQFALDSSDGKAKAGAGAVILDADGVKIEVGSGDVNKIKFRDTANNLTAAMVRGSSSTSGPPGVRNGALHLEAFMSDGSSNAAIVIDAINSEVRIFDDLRADGVGIFAGGVRTRVVSSVPTGGSSGDIALYESGGTRRMYCNVNGTWRYAALT